MEKWKDIEGYEGLYRISNHGNVYSCRSGKNISVRGVNAEYYPIAHLCKKGEIKSIAAHRLVATYFVPNPINKPCVNHKDGSRTNNYYLNLEWVTHKENTQHALQNGVIFSPNPAVGERTPKSKLTENQVLFIRASSLSQKQLSEKHNVSITAISLILNRKSWKHI